MHQNISLKMFEISQNLIVVGMCGLIALGVFQLLISIILVSSVKNLNRETHTLLKEAYGCLRKIEGLTASRREQLQKQYDKIMEQLTARLPVIIASQASASIFETEKKILTRLAELEPNLKDDAGAQRKLNDLIKSMEDLEHTVVSLTAESVRKVLSDSKGDFFSSDEKMAA